MCTLSWICALCTFLLTSQSELVPSWVELDVLIFVSTVLRTMVLIEDKDVFRRSFQTILESPEFGKWPCYSIPKAN